MVNVALLLCAVAAVGLTLWQLRAADPPLPASDILIVAPLDAKRPPEAHPRAVPVGAHEDPRLAPAFPELKRFAPSRHVTVIVAILSAPKDFDERRACRETWLRLSEDALPLFVIGTTQDETLNARVRQEAVDMGDVLLLDLVEDYRRLVFKTSAVFDFVARREDVTFDFVLKTDDDSFVRLDLLVPLLKKTGGRRVYWGSHNAHVRKAASPEHKWFDKHWKEPFYPTYALGSAYALSADLVGVLASLDVSQRPMFSVEDAGTGIWLSTHVGEAQLKRVHADQKQFPLIETGTTTGVCEPEMIVRRHCHDVALMRQFYANLQTCGDMCCGATVM